MPDAVNLAEKLSLLTEHWSPRIVSRYNGNDVMVVKVQGAFEWHSHSDTDDFFLVLDGAIRLDTEDGPVHLKAGELFVVPRGMRHRPVAEQEAMLLLIEPAGTPNTGVAETAAMKQEI